MAKHSCVCAWECSSPYRFSSFALCPCTHPVHGCRSTPGYAGPCFLSSSAREDFVSSCPVLMRRWPSRFCPPWLLYLMLWHPVLLHITLVCALALIWIFLCSGCLVVQPSSMAPLTGLLGNRAPFIIVLLPGEGRKLQVPTDFHLVSETNCLTFLSS